MASAKVTEAINLIKLSQKTTEIYVPSLKSNVRFKHLTAGQQERFVQALVDNPAVQTKFIITLFDIIKDNCEDKSLINKFTIIDKYAIGIALRVASIGSMLKTEVDGEPGVIYNINLVNTINYVKDQINHTPLDSIHIDEFTIDLQYPTMNQEVSNERYFKKDDSTLDNSVEGIRAIISNALISEVLMFINTLTIDNKESPIVLDFNQLTIQDKLDVVRRLPNTIFEKMIDPMSSVKRQIEGMLKGVGVSEADSNIKRSILVSFDASLFITAS